MISQHSIALLLSTTTKKIDTFHSLTFIRHWWDDYDESSLMTAVTFTTIMEIQQNVLMFYWEVSVLILSSSVGLLGFTALHLIFSLPFWYILLFPFVLCGWLTMTEIWQLSTDSATTRAWECFSWATFSLLLRRLSTAWRCLVHLAHQVKENLREVKVSKRLSWERWQKFGSFAPEIQYLMFSTELQS